MTNRLAAETSPYLLQHAENPVDWYPWGDEAFGRAKQEDKPILLSVGYSACHWCHVMARESFRDPATASLMNKLFINIKVDREEHPDVDGIYMQAVQAMTGSGGWPMTVFLTPEGVPWWGGTYYPPVDRHGMPAFTRVLRVVADAWKNKKDAVEQTAETMRALYANANAVQHVTGLPDRALLERAAERLMEQADRINGGFGDAPKFPSTMALAFLLRAAVRTDNKAMLEIVQQSFRAMANGGIYDQVGGGFHRYSVDNRWLVPHFEKMLYDNALLVRLGVELWQVTGDHDVKRVVAETLEWVMREMSSPSGGFFASLDAESEGREGWFYLWPSEEFDAVLGDDAATMRGYWGVSESGHLDGRSILNVAGHLTQEQEAIRKRSVTKLLAAREKRIRPARDEKVLASWNGLMLRAIADAARVFSSEKWLAAAIANGEFLLKQMVKGGKVSRVYAGGVSRLDGLLEDHAAVGLGFLALHAATLDPRWIEAAISIAQEMECRFRDSDGGWYDTASDSAPLITRPREQSDNATPSGVSQAMELLLQLSELTGKKPWSSEVELELARLADRALDWPLGYGNALSILDMLLYDHYTVVIVASDLSQAEQLLAEASRRFGPGMVVAGHAGAGKMPALPVFDGRGLTDGRATAYLCRGFVCQLPVTEAQALAQQLDSAIPALSTGADGI